MKTSNLLHVTLLVLFSVVLNSCIATEPPFYCLYLENQTEDELYTIFKFYHMNGNDCFTKEKALSKDVKYRHQKSFPDRYTTLWSFDYRPGDFLKPTDTLTIFILDKEEYEGRTWSQLVDSTHFRQVYHLSGDDIRLIGKDIPYPPSEKMRYMDMEPPYEEAVRN